jgi:hypothetical protein
MPEDLCQYCGADLDAQEPGTEVGYLYGIECRACPPGQRRTCMLPRSTRVDSLACPDCGAVFSASAPDVLVIKELTYDICPRCGERCGVRQARKIRDSAGGTI